VLARVQQLISALLWAGIATALGVGALLDKLAYGAAVPGVAAALYMSILAGEFWVLWRSYDREDPERPGLAQLVRAWAEEATTAARIFLWRQPFRSRIEADHLPASVSGRRGVLLVHGFLCNRGLWNPWMRRLRVAHVPFIAVNLEPIFGSIDSYRQIIEAAVRDLEQATALAPVIVAHSMGGLAVRAWLGGDAESKRFHRAVLIASPHRGTRMAGRGFAPNVAQMRPANAWLAGLASHEPTSLRERFVCFWSHCDNIVVPARSATLVGADNRHLEATPHVRMVYHPAVFASVLELVEAKATRPAQRRRN
jgi:triacylglycerol lipase